MGASRAAPAQRDSGCGPGFPPAGLRPQLTPAAPTPDHPPGTGRGLNFIDTADVYSAGESEQIVGKALGGDMSLPGNRAKLEAAEDPLTADSRPVEYGRKVMNEG